MLDQAAQSHSSQLPVPSAINLTAQPNIMQDSVKRMKFTEGMSLLEILLCMQPNIKILRHAVVAINGHVIHKKYWHCVYPNAGTEITMKIVPQDSGGGGGKSPFRMLLMVAIIVAAIYLGPALGAAMGIGKAGIAIGAGVTLSAAQVGGAIIMTVGMVLINLIAPIKPPKLATRTADSKDSPTLFIEGARNNIRPFEPVPVVLGKHRQVPPFGVRSYTEIVGDDQYLRLLVIWGYGPLLIENIRVGETPIESFDDVEMETREGYDDDDPITLIPNSVIETGVGASLSDSEWVVRTSGVDADELSVDFTFPGGLSGFSDDGNKTNFRVVVDIEYSVAGADSWTARPSFDITGRQTNALRRGDRWATPTRGQFDVRLRRNPGTPKSTSDRVIDELEWTVLRTITDEDPIQFEHPVAMTAMRIKATDQLNRVLDEVNADITTICPDWDIDTQTWIERPTQNCGSLLRYVYQGNANGKRLADNRVDIEGLQEFAEHCIEHNFACNHIVDYQSTVYEISSLVAACGRASPGMRDNKWGVVIDKPQDIPVQLFTPRNSWGFKAEKAFMDQPHGWRIPFINEEQGYRPDERLVFADGYTQETATIYEVLEFQGQTHTNQIWKNGRFHLAQIKLRPERWSFSAPYEHMLCRRGSRIGIQHDVIVVGICSGRIKSISLDESDNVIAVTVDEQCVMETANAYGIVVRTADNAKLNIPIVTNDEDPLNLTFITPLSIASGPRAGDLFSFGLLGSETVDAIVLTIEPSDNENAVISCMPYSPAVYSADSGDVPEYETGITLPAGLTIPVINNIRSDDTALVAIPGGGWQSRILISFTLPSVVNLNERRIQGRFRPIGVTASWTLLGQQPAESGEYSILEVTDGETYEIQFRYIDGNDKPGTWSSSYEHTVIGKSLPPPQVGFFGVEQQPDGTRLYTMEMDTVPRDFAGFEIRYYVGWTAPDDWDQFTPLHAGHLTASPWESNDLAAGQYTFAVKAVDTSGNLSEDPVYAEVEFGDPRLRNVILARNERTLVWPGTKNDCFVDSDGILRPVATSGGTWGDLSGTAWSDLSGDAWFSITARENPISYETPVIDLSADISCTPLITAVGLGTVTVEMKTGTDADGTVTGAYAAISQISLKRYVQFKVTADLAGGAAIEELQIILDGEAIVVEYNDVNTNTETAAWIDQLAAGHFLIADKTGRLGVITQASIIALQGVGAGWSWELISKTEDISSVPAAEFKIYNGSGTLADAVVDIQLRGVRGT